MLDQDPDRNIGFLMHDVSRRLRQRFDRRARALGLTRAQWRVMVHLGPRQGINQAALAEILELDTVTLGRHVDKLEAAGWLERRPDPGDRRAWCLHLSAKAEPIIRQMATLVGEVQGAALTGIDPADAERVVETLLAMKRNLMAADSAGALKQGEAADD
jgi:DNA-binding MarR family transcriptional regulator